MSVDGVGLTIAQFEADGWAAADINVQGVYGMKIADSSGSPINSTPAIIAAERAAGFDPRVWVFALGVNDSFHTPTAGPPFGFDSLRGAAIQTVCDAVFAGPRSDYVIHWIGFGFPRLASRLTEASTFNTTMAFYVSKYPGKFIAHDFYTYCQNTLTSVGNTTYDSYWFAAAGNNDPHFSALGYTALRFPFIGAALASEAP